MDAPGGAIDEGRSALALAQWAQALLVFDAVLADRDDASAHEGRSVAFWFLGDLPGAVSEREQAFEGHVAGGEPGAAARCAVWLAHQRAVGGQPSAARGWLARAERLVENAPGSAGYGWVCMEHARQASPGSEQAAWAERAMATAQRVRDADLEVLAGEPARTLRDCLRAAGSRYGTARGSHGGRNHGPGLRPAHPRRGLLQPGHGVC